MRKYWYISCSASSLQAVYPLPSTIVGARTAQPLAALPPYGCGVPLAGAARPLSRPQAGFPGVAAPAPVGCLSFSCVAKKRTQKKARKGGHPLFQPPVLSKASALHPRRPKPAYSGTPAPTAVPRPGVVDWQGPQSTPGPVRYGKPLIGANLCAPKDGLRADAHIGPSPPGDTSNKGAQGADMLYGACVAYGSEPRLPAKPGPPAGRWPAGERTSKEAGGVFAIPGGNGVQRTL